MRKNFFSDEEYAVVVLQNLRRAVKRSDYMLAFIPPRDIMCDTVDAAEVSSALLCAIDCLRDRLRESDQRAG